MIDRRALLEAGASLSATTLLPVSARAIAPTAPPVGPAHSIRVERNVPIPLRDGSVAFADIFRPEGVDDCRFPVLLTMGVYGESLTFRHFNPEAWARVEVKSGERADDYLNWETPLPDFWVPAGYVVIRCDQPGSGDSPGKLDIFGPQTQRALYDAIEWAGVQRWSSGKVGMLGASYYGLVQWLVAQHRPPHLAAILPFQGFTDVYRDSMRHGGILTAGFVDYWYRATVLPRQYGAPTGTSAAKLNAAQLAAATVFPKDMREMMRDDALRLATAEFYRERTPDLLKIDVPIYAWANDDGLGLHLRGTIEGFTGSTNAPHRWLRTHAGPEPDTMYTREAMEAHKRFFDFFLKGKRNGFDREPRVAVTVKKGGGPFALRTGDAYPPRGTNPQTLYLDCNGGRLSAEAPLGPGIAGYRSEYGRADSIARFSTDPMPADTELIEPMKLHLTLTVDGPDCDLFVAVREFQPDGQEVTTRGTPISMGWLRASLRNADPARSSAFRTWHTYDRIEPLTPGVPLTVDVNIWPAAWIVAQGNTLALEIGGTEQKGTVAYTHPVKGPYAPDGITPLDNGVPAPARVLLHSGGEDASHLVVPVFQALL